VIALAEQSGDVGLWDVAPVIKVVWNEGHGCNRNGRVEKEWSLEMGWKRERFWKKLFRSVGIL